MQRCRSSRNSRRKSWDAKFETQNLRRRIRGAKSVAQNLRREICEVKHAVLPGLQREMYLVLRWLRVVRRAMENTLRLAGPGTRLGIRESELKVARCATLMKFCVYN
jgi:hypothetical protein